MPWSIAELEVASADELKDELSAAFDEREQKVTPGRRDEDPDGKRPERKKQIAPAVKAIKTILDSGQAGDAPWIVSVAAHPPVGASGSRPYLSVSVVGTSQPRPRAVDPTPGG